MKLKLAEEIWYKMQRIYDMDNAISICKKPITGTCEIVSELGERISSIPLSKQQTRLIDNSTLRAFKKRKKELTLSIEKINLKRG